MIRRPPRSPLFPYTPLSRSDLDVEATEPAVDEIHAVEDRRGKGEPMPPDIAERSEEHTSELQSPCNFVCRLLLEKKNSTPRRYPVATPRHFCPALPASMAQL